MSSFRSLKNSLLTIRGLQKLSHAVGKGSHIPRRDWGSRNSYTCADRDADLDALVFAGLATRMEYVPNGVNPYRHVYSATSAGAELLGLTNKQVNAMRRLEKKATDELSEKSEAMEFVHKIHNKQNK